MQNVLPAETGLVVNGIAWRYSVDKNAADPFFVNIEQNSVAGSRLFTFTDNWTGLPGNNIVRGAPLNLLGENMASGALTTDGFGTVFNESIVYTYQYNPCSDISCPEFIPPAPQVMMPTLEQVTLRDDDQEELERRQALVKEKKREAGTIGLDTLSSQFFALDNIPSSYYIAMPGGFIEDSFLPARNISDNSKGRRMGFAQQRLHNEMVNAQYEEK